MAQKAPDRSTTRETDDTFDIVLDEASRRTAVLAPESLQQILGDAILRTLTHELEVRHLRVTAGDALPVNERFLQLTVLAASSINPPITIAQFQNLVSEATQATRIKAEQMLPSAFSRTATSTSAGITTAGALDSGAAKRQEMMGEDSEAELNRKRAIREAMIQAMHDAGRENGRLHSGSSRSSQAAFAFEVSEVDLPPRGATQERLDDFVPFMEPLPVAIGVTIPELPMDFGHEERGRGIGLTR